MLDTNQSIENYDFFNANNVVVVDRKNVSIPSGFFNSAYTRLPDEVYEKYSLKSWILEVLS